MNDNNSSSDQPESSRADVPTSDLDPAGTQLAGTPLVDYGAEISQLQRTGHTFHQRGWSVGTSSNYSLIVQRNPLLLLVTASGKDKGQLQPHDFVLVDAKGAPVTAGQPKSSAETLLHIQAAQDPEIGAVLHTHSVWTTLLSQHFFEAGGFEISGYEMLKGFRGIQSHETAVWVDIFDNTQDIAALAQRVQESLGRHALANGLSVPPGYLIRRHGLYTWGRDLAEARRHIEIWEFLLECVGRQTRLTS